MNRHILIVEDDTNMREALAGVLEDVGYLVTQAADGETAIAFLTQAVLDGVPYEVVITDIVMGAVDGIEVLKVATSQPYMPEVILLTGHGTMETAMTAVRAGAFDYLLKPCRIADLLDRVMAALEYRRNRLIQVQAVETLRSIASALGNVLETGMSVPKPPAIAPAQADDPERLPGRYVEIGLLRIDTYRHEVWFDGEEVSVTPIEYALLACLAETPERAVGFSEIALYTHKKELERNDARQLLISHVRNVRNKIDRRYVVSVPGTGYMLVNPDG